MTREEKHLGMNRIGIVFNTEKERARLEMTRLEEWLRLRGCKTVVIPSNVQKVPRLNFALTLGGDGTMLKASRFLAPARIPVLGVNLGSLGFLAETDPNEVYAFLDHILANGFRTENRSMLAVTLQSKAGLSTHYVLNECLIHSGSNSRVLTVSVDINDNFLADYVGDGLIIATPTGSTAYSLAAFGPIVHPRLSVYILTPICPHTLTQRPMILPLENTLTLRVNTRGTRQKPVLSLDGQTNQLLSPKDTVTVTAAPHPLKLIVNPNRKYLDVLRTKLKWGERG